MAKQDKPEADAAAAAKPAAPAANESVFVVVTKFGDGKVSTGEHIAGQGDIYAAKGAQLSVSAEAAKELEAKGLVETD